MFKAMRLRTDLAVEFNCWIFFFTLVFSLSPFYILIYMINETVIDNGTVYNVKHVQVDVINAPIDNVISIQVNRI